MDCRAIHERATGDRKGQSNACGVGWEYVHICIDDASRVAVTGIFPDEKAVSAIAALQAAVAYYQSLGVTVTRVMTPSRQIASQSPVIPTAHPRDSFGIPKPSEL